MDKVTIEEAQAHLIELIEKMTPGQEVIIMRDDQPIAQLISLPNSKPYPLPGRCKGKLTIVSEDAEHLQDWSEYMP